MTLAAESPSAKSVSYAANQGMHMEEAGVLRAEASLAPVDSCSPPGTSGILTRTTRKSWLDFVVQELRDLLFVLTSDGHFLHLSPSVKSLTGYEPDELTGQIFYDYLHPDDTSLFIREFKESIATGKRLRLYYRLHTKTGKYVMFECHGHPHRTDGGSQLVSDGDIGVSCPCFFMMARPHPTPQGQLLDSFLELKMENERLRTQIAALKCEDAGEVRVQPKSIHTDHNSVRSSHLAGSTGQPPTHTAGFPSTEAEGTASKTQSSLSMAVELKRLPTTPGLSVNMASSDSPSPVNSIARPKGLPHFHHQLLHDASAHGKSSALVRGDQGILYLAGKDRPVARSSLYKKKPKFRKTVQHLCAECGTLSSCEWRKGPNGPKTLCNACGLRWSKGKK
ncbi:white collar 2 type of transcription factor [Rhinocladiella similis]